MKSNQQYLENWNWTFRLKINLFLWNWISFNRHLCCRRVLTWKLAHRPDWKAGRQSCCRESQKVKLNADNSFNSDMISLTKKLSATFRLKFGCNNKNQALKGNSIFVFACNQQSTRHSTKSSKDQINISWEFCYTSKQKKKNKRIFFPLINATCNKILCSSIKLPQKQRWAVK